MLTQQQAIELLDYDAETGLFTWKPRQNNNKFNATRAGKTCGRTHKNGYVDIGINGKKIAAHRLAWLYVKGQWPAEIDHINGDRADNRLANLRECTHAENCQNYPVKTSNTSGFPGVSWHKGAKCWRATIVINRKQKSLGTFDTRLEAYQAYLAAKNELHKFNPTVRG